MTKFIRPGIFDSVGQPENMTELYEEWKDCPKCQILARKRQNVAIVNPTPQHLDCNRDPHTGKLEYPPVLVVGQAPGRDEDKCGIPFTGQLGRHCIENYVCGRGGIPVGAVTAMNTLACPLPSGPGGRLSTSTAFARNCHSLLDSAIHIMKPALIVVMGRYAMRRFGYSGTVGKCRRSVGFYKNSTMILTALPALTAHMTGEEQQEQAAEELNADYRAVMEVAARSPIKEAIDLWVWKLSHWQYRGLTLSQ